MAPRAWGPAPESERNSGAFVWLSAPAARSRGAPCAPSSLCPCPGPGAARSACLLPGDSARRRARPGPGPHAVPGGGAGSPPERASEPASQPRSGRPTSPASSARLRALPALLPARRGRRALKGPACSQCADPGGDRGRCPSQRLLTSRCGRPRPGRWAARLLFPEGGKRLQPTPRHSQPSVWGTGVTPNATPRGGRKQGRRGLPAWVE